MSYWISQRPCNVFSARSHNFVRSKLRQRQVSCYEYKPKLLVLPNELIKNKEHHNKQMHLVKVC